MKKTLAILLSLALMICMIPATAATAWADATEEQSAAYTVTVSGIYTYNGTAQTPSITVSETQGGASVTGYTVEYYSAENTNGTALSENPKNAGKYTVKVKKEVAGSGDQSGGGTTATIKWGTATFTIAKASLGSGVTIVEKEAKLTSLVTNATQLKNYYQVELNGEAIDEDVTLSATQTDDQKTSNKVTITATAKTQNVEGSYASVFDIKTNLTSSAITCSQVGTLTYNGSAQKPTFNVKLSANMQQLYENTDYVVGDYSENKNANEKATTSIKGIGKYCGTVTEVAYRIEQKSITGSNTTITTGNTVVSAEPNIQVVCDGVALIKGTDYELSGAETNSVGNKTFTVTGKGNYTGIRTATLKVVAAANDVSNLPVYQGSNQLTSNSSLSSIYNYYTGSTLPAQNITVYTNKTTGSTLSTYNYDVVYEYTDANGKTVSTTAPVNAKKYDVYIVGKNDYAGKQKIGTYEILKHKMSKYDLNISVSMASATAEPAVTVRSAYYTNTVFTKGTDYTVYASPYTYNGKRTVTITSTGTGSLEAGSVSDSYAVVSKSISSCTVSFKDGKTSAAYTGYTIPVQIVVKDGYYTTLTENQQYTVTYKNEAGKAVSSIKDAGRYTIEITGKNGYTGTTYLYFTVTGNDISTYTVVLDKTSIDATGYSVTLPKVTKVYSGSTTLYSTNYTVSYQNAAGTTITGAYAPGTYKVAVAGAGKYSGTAYATFTIVGKNQTITGVESTYKVYPTSEAFKLTPKATEGTFTYTSSDGSVATVSSTGVVTPLKAGRAKITIKTTGNTKYNPAEFSTVIKVYPTKAVMTKKPWTTGKSKIKVRWNKQDNVTRYEIRYSRVKSFASGTYITKKVNAAQNDYTTQSTTISNLKSGQKYYVKVRAVKEVYNDYGKKLTYYGAWSGWRTVVAK